MKLIPPESQERIDYLQVGYSVDDGLSEVHIVHMYPLDYAYPDGYVDSRFFRLLGFNTDTMTRRDFGEHDSFDTKRLFVPVDIIRIYADGSTMIRFKTPIHIDGRWQAAEFW